MDQTIAQWSDGERATLSYILSRGLSSLTKQERADGRAAALVAQLQTVLRETPRLDAHSAATLAMLIFKPQGLHLHGVQNAVLTHLHDLGHITRSELRGVWTITRSGWLQVWNSGQAHHLLADRHGVTLPAPEDPA